MQTERRTLQKVNDETLVAGVYVGLTTDGDCVIKGFGELSTAQVESVSRSLVLLAARLRNEARKEPAYTH